MDRHFSFYTIVLSKCWYWKQFTTLSDHSERRGSQWEEIRIFFLNNQRFGPPGFHFRWTEALSPLLVWVDIWMTRLFKRFLIFVENNKPKVRVMDNCNFLLASINKLSILSHLLLIDRRTTLNKIFRLPWRDSFHGKISYQAEKC